MGKITERTVSAERVEDLISVFGSFDENIKRIEDALSVSIVNRGTELKVTGEEEAADKAVRTLEGLISLSARGEIIDIDCLKRMFEDYFFTIASSQPTR